MGALLLTIGKWILSAAIFTGTQALLEGLFDKDEDTIIDEVFSAAITAGVVNSAQKKQIADAIRITPLPTQVTDAKSAGNFLSQLAENKAGLEALNARLGGFAPLAIKITKTAASILPKLASISKGKMAIIVGLITALFWAPQLIQNLLDQGVFAPEQANKILESWGLPFRWPISEARATETQLKEVNLAKALEQGLSTGLQKTPTTRISLSTTTKPKLLLGTIFSSLVKKTDTFDRVLDDAITSRDDLMSDAQQNLNRWLTTLPGRLIYSISIQNNPFDELGVKHTGTWITLGIGLRQLSGAFKPLDTILLGPIDPIVYIPKATETHSVQVELPKLLEAKEITEIKFPDGDIDIIDNTGKVVPVSFGQQSPSLGATAGQPEATSTVPSVPSVPATPPVVSPPVTTSEKTTPITLPAELRSPLAAQKLWPLRVTVLVDALMVRAAPNTSAPLAGSQRLVRGNTFKAVDAVLGESVQGQPWWWKSEFGNYVWSGGTDEGVRV